MRDRQGGYPSKSTPSPLPKVDPGPAPGARVVMSTDLVQSTSPNPMQALHEAMVFSSNDWGAAPDFAWIYGIIVGWGPDDDEPESDDAIPSLAEQHGWTPEQVDHLRALHAAFKRATTPAPIEFPQPAEGTATCLACGGSRNTAYEQRMNDLVAEFRRQIRALQRALDRARGQQPAGHHRPEETS